MITAAITAAVGALLALFGVRPGPYLVGVAVGVKVVIVAVTLTFGARWMRQRAAEKAVGDSAGESGKKQGHASPDEPGSPERSPPGA